jgi:hypothetical protein
MDILIHAANVLYLVSYFTRDILWLRVFTVIAASCLAGYFYFGVFPLLPAVYWNLVFIVLNLCWIVRLILERGRMPPDEAEKCFHKPASRTAARPVRTL